MPTNLPVSSPSSTDQSGQASDQINPAIPTQQFDIKITHSLGDIKKIWRRFEKQTAISCYQRFDFVESWFQHLGQKKGFHPYIISGLDKNGELAFILPFAIKSSLFGKILTWSGDKHTNYNMGLIKREQISEFAPRTILEILDTARAIAHFDAIHLLNLPKIWEGQTSPFLPLKRNQSPSFGYWADFSEGYHEYFERIKSKRARKRIRWQERRLHEMGTMSFERAKNQEQVEHYIQTHFELRKIRFESIGKHDNLAEPGVREFITDLATRAPKAEKPPLELHAMLIDGEIKSIYGGAVAGNRFSAFFNSIDIGPTKKYSAGDTLLHHLIKNCAERGFTAFDLGIGEADYKMQWCDRTDIMFDVFLAFTPKGKIFCLIASKSRILKGMIKRRPGLFKISLRLQSMFQR